MKALGSRLLRVFSSIGTSCTLLILLGLLTWLGTLEQVDHGLYEVQKKYFESFFLVHQAGPIPIPLPGANLVMCLLFVNLIIGGIVRLRIHGPTVGVLVTHVGILMLLGAGFVKMYHADEGHVTLFEGQQATHFESYYRWELVVGEPLPDGRVREHVARQEQFADALGATPKRIEVPGLPLALEVRHYQANTRPQQKGPMFEVDVPVVDGLFLRERPLQKEAETNIAGLYVAVLGTADGSRRDGLVWGAQSAPWTVQVGGKTYAIDLRHERYALPFTLALEDFEKIDHPGTGMPKSFSSDVQVTEGPSARDLTISMNEPLRSGGLVIYQASWGPSTARPGDPLFSTFAVVRNPADQYPLYACIVIALGMLLHFSRKLIRHVRLEARRA